MGIDRAAIDSLFDRARREIDQGLLPSCQLALAYRGELIAERTLGDATDDSRYVVFSATKPFVAGAMWALIGDGLLDVSLPVAHYLDGWSANGKGAVTVEQVMLHTSGFPLAPMPDAQASTSEGRRAAFAQWRLDWEPGSRYVYHPESAHWVLVELITAITGRDHRDLIAERVSGPAGLPVVLGRTGHRAMHMSAVGEPAGAQELMDIFGVAELPANGVTTEGLLRFNEPFVQELGHPGGGGVMRARDLALFYQALLTNPGEMWRPDVWTDATTRVRNSLPDAMLGHPANRTLGLVMAGGDGKSHLRGMGHTVSPGTIGHNGAKGQIAWGDPATGLSFAYCTNGLDEHVLREPRRGTALSSLAARCVVAD